MPFKSKAQRRKFYAMARSGEISPETVEKWEKETPKGKKLPEHVEKKASRREKQTAGEKIRRGALIGSATATGAGIGVSGSAIHDLLQKRKLDKLEKIQKGAVKPHPMFSHPVAPGKSKEIQRLKRLVSRSSTGKALLATGLGATALGGTAYIADALSNRGKEKKAALEIDFYALRQAALEKVGGRRKKRRGTGGDPDLISWKDVLKKGTPLSPRMKRDEAYRASVLGVDLAKVAFYEEMEKIAIRGLFLRGAGSVARRAGKLFTPRSGALNLKGTAPSFGSRLTARGEKMSRRGLGIQQFKKWRRANPDPASRAGRRKGRRELWQGDATKPLSGGPKANRPTGELLPPPKTQVVAGTGQRRNKPPAAPKPTAATPPPAAPKPTATSAAPADQPFLQKHFGLTPGAEGGMLGGKGVSDWFSKLTPDQRTKVLAAGGVGLAGGGFLAGKALGGGGDRKVVYV